MRCASVGTHSMPNINKDTVHQPNHPSTTISTICVFTLLTAKWFRNLFTTSCSMIFLNNNLSLIVGTPLSYAKILHKIKRMKKLLKIFSLSHSNMNGQINAKGVYFLQNS